MNWKNYWNFLRSFKAILISLSLLLTGCAVTNDTIESCVLEINKCTPSGCKGEEKLIVSLGIQSEEELSYKRSSYGGGWVDEDSDCQDTRAEVLIATSLIRPVLSVSACKVKMGLWYDPYSDLMFEQASDLDIDHFIPLKEAHVSGAYLWDKKKRLEFANEYKTTGNLLPVWNSLNRSKGAREPLEWMPPNKNYHCEYANRWAYLKWNWGLSVDVEECRNLRNIISKCNVIE